MKECDPDFVIESRFQYPERAKKKGLVFFCFCSDLIKVGSRFFSWLALYTEAPHNAYTLKINYKNQQKKTSKKIYKNQLGEIKMFNDTISDVLTRIRNANLRKKARVSIPFTKISHQISQILEKQGFIKSFKTYKKFDNKTKKFPKIILLNLKYIKQKKLKINEVRYEVYLKRVKLKQEKHLQRVELLKARAEKFKYRFIQPRKPRIRKFRRIGKSYVRKYNFLFKEIKPCFSNLRRISKPGLRVYANSKEIPDILGLRGIVIMSTSQGVMTGKEAQKRRIGGELLCSIW